MDQFDRLLAHIGRPQFFSTGELRITNRAEAALTISEVFDGLNRHVTGESEMTEHERESFQYAVEEGGPIFTAHWNSSDTLFCILTDAERVRTYVWLVDEAIPPLCP